MHSSMTHGHAPDFESDEALMHRIATGDSDAFSGLVERHSRKFYGLAFRLLGTRSDAEDVVQDAFLKLWTKPDRWDPAKQTRFTTWFYRVVMNLCLDHKRRKKATPMPEHYEAPDPAQPIDDQYSRKQQQELIEHHIASLPVQQQMALNLCFYEGVSNREAADILDISVKALESLLMRAKTKLKMLIAHENRWEAL